MNGFYKFTKKTPEIFLALIIIIILNACSAEAPNTLGVQEGITYPSPDTSATIPPNEDLPLLTSTPLSGEALVRQSIAKQLNVNPAILELHSHTTVDWPDSCLGLPKADEVCAQQITPGYRGMVFVGQEQYEFHSSRSGNVRLVASAALVARHQLSELLGIPLEDIHFKQVEQVEWPDACLGIYQPDVMCAQLIVPGYMVILDVDGRLYKYHTDLSGAQVSMAKSPDSPTSHPVIEWAWIHDGNCDSASISLETVVYGPCARAQITGKFVAESSVSELNDFMGLYAPFEADTPAGKVLFSGQGEQVASLAEQSMIAEWSRLVFQEAQAGRGGAAWGLALAWNRQGGIAGFCDDLAVYVTGEAQTSSCKPGSTQDRKSIHLTTEELETFYQWLDMYRPFELKQNDSGVADALRIYLVFYGTGEENTPTEVQKDILTLAEHLFYHAQDATR